jgi:hypothetical protein
MRMQSLLAGAVVTSLALSGCGGSSGSPQPSATLGPAAHTINGQVSYAGTVLDGHQIVVGAVLSGGSGAPAYSTVLSGPGAYSLTGVADGSYAVFAFIDQGDDMGAPQATEPLGWYDAATDGTADEVVMAEGAAAIGVDIAIVDR